MGKNQFALKTASVQGRRFFVEESIPREGPAGFPYIRLDMDIFDRRAAKLMPVASESLPFDSDEFTFELKLNGERCLAYLGDGDVELLDGKGRNLIPRFPELAGIREREGRRCILDGVLVAGIGNREDHALVRKRLLTRRPAAAVALSREIPFILVALDILYLGTRRLTALSLAERQAILRAAVDDSERLCPIRSVDERGIDFYNLVMARDLDGIVAKRKSSAYRMGERTREWIEIGGMRSADFVICGFVPGWDAAGTSLILGQYAADGALVYKGRVSIDGDRDELPLVERQPRTLRQPFAEKTVSHGDAIWCEPRLVCTVGFAGWTAKGLRRPFFMGLRLDKLPYAAAEPA